MRTKIFLVTSLFLFISQFAFSQVQELSVDFSVSPGTVSEGSIQVAYEWLTPHDFRKTDLSIIDTQNLSGLHPGSNHIIASKVAFISKGSFDGLSYASKNNKTPRAWPTN